MTKYTTTDRVIKKNTDLIGESKMEFCHGHWIYYEGSPQLKHTIDVLGAGKGFDSQYSKDDVYAQFDSWATGCEYVPPVKAPETRIVRRRIRHKTRETVVEELLKIPCLPTAPIPRKRISASQHSDGSWRVAFQVTKDKKTYTVHYRFTHYQEVAMQAAEELCDIINSVIKMKQEAAV